jgi:hypothetical protein
MMWDVLLQEAPSDSRCEPEAREELEARYLRMCGIPPVKWRSPRP